MKLRGVTSDEGRRSIKNSKTSFLWASMFCNRSGRGPESVIISSRKSEQYSLVKEGSVVNARSLSPTLKTLASVALGWTERRPDASHCDEKQYESGADPLSELMIEYIYRMTLK